MIKISYCRLVCFLVVSIAATNANAELILRFGQPGGNILSNNINVTPGTQVQLDLFLTQTGLQGFGFSEVSEDRLQTNSLGPSGLGIAGIVHATIQGSSAGGVTFSGSQANRIDGSAPALTINPDFVLQTVGATFQESQFLSFDAFARQISPVAVQPVFASSTRIAQFGVPTEDLGGTVEENSVLIGTLSFDVSSNAFGTYNISAVNDDQGGPRGFLLGGDSLDGLFGASPAEVSFQAFSFSVVAVPEPSLLGLLVASVGAVGFQRRRR